jgi:hypothetical protein
MVCLPRTYSCITVCVCVFTLLPWGLHAQRKVESIEPLDKQSGVLCTHPLLSCSQQIGVLYRGAQNKNGYAYNGRSSLLVMFFSCLFMA